MKELTIKLTDHDYECLEKYVKYCNEYYAGKSFTVDMAIQMLAFEMLVEKREKLRVKLANKEYEKMKEKTRLPF